MLSLMGSFVGVEPLMVGTSTQGVNEPSHDSLGQKRVWDVKFNRGIKLLFPLLHEVIQHVCLPTVREKTCRRKPFLHGGMSKFFSLSSTTIASLTSFPVSIVTFSFSPSFEPEADWSSACP